MSSSVCGPGIPAAEISFCVLRQQQLSRQFNVMQGARLIQGLGFCVAVLTSRQPLPASNRLLCAAPTLMESLPCCPGPLPGTVSASREQGMCW